MNNLNTVSNETKYSFSQDNSSKLQQLVEWCKIVHACLDSQQVDDAKFFLEQAIAEAEKFY